jgi:hypothetical protein
MIEISRRIAEFWCRMMHRSPLWPSHGHYRCRTCWREYPVPWQVDLRTSLSPRETARLFANSSSPMGDAIAPSVQPAHPW